MGGLPSIWIEKKKGSPDPTLSIKSQNLATDCGGKERNRGKIRAHKLDNQQTLPSTRSLPSWGEAFLLSTLPPGMIRVRKGLNEEGGALPAPTPPPRLGVAAPSATPGVAQRDRG